MKLPLGFFLYFFFNVQIEQGAEIFDNAFCGGGDPNQGLTPTAVPISTAALAQIKAVILQGDPQYVYGLSYDVGSCTAGGVCSSLFLVPVALGRTNVCLSLMLARQASYAQELRRFRVTVTLLTLIVATEVIRRLIKAMEVSTVQRPSPSWRASSAPLAPEPRRQLPLLPQRRRRHHLVAHALHCTVSVVASAIQAPRAVLQGLASTRALTTHNACEGR